MITDGLIEKFKPVINELIQYYYCIGGNSAGGNLHISLDDGNLSENHIWSCQRLCLDSGDNIGFLIGSVLRCFTQEEREQMYTNYWGMKKSQNGICIFFGKNNGEI